MLITKREEVTKQGFCKILWRKLRPQESLLLEFIHSSVGWGWAIVWVWLERGGGGRLFEARRLLTFSAFRMGAYSRWVLIRSWERIRINTVCGKFGEHERGIRVAWGAAESNSSLLNALWTSHVLNISTYALLKYEPIIVYNITKVINVAVNLKYYYYSTRSKQNMSMSTYMTIFSPRS